MSEHEPRDRELTPDEKAAFADLSREKAPGRLLEERIVADLSRRGLLAAARRAGARRPVWWLAAAAALAMIVASFALGHMLGSRETANLMLALDGRNAEQVIHSVETTGDAYRQALVQLTALRGAAPSAERTLGREAALSTIYAVADEMLRIAPDDPLAARIMQAFDSASDSLPPAIGRETRSVVWF